MSAAPETRVVPIKYHAVILLPNGSVVDTRPLIASGDEQAAAIAKSMVKGHAVELWHGLRFVEHFEAADSSP